MVHTMNHNDYALVIEDSISMRKFVSLILRQETNFQHVVEAESPDQALTLIQQRPGRLSLIISDWNMPGTPLQNVLQQLQAQLDISAVPLFLLTATGDAQAQQIARAIQAKAVLTKPFNADDLIGLIELHIPIERRRAKRVIPLTRCEVDLGFDPSQQSYIAEVVNISETGVLIRSPIAAPGLSCIYDYVSLTLLPVDGQVIKTHGQIVRIEVDPQRSRNHCNSVLIAFEFGRVDEATLTQLRHYVALNSAHPEDGTH